MMNFYIKKPRALRIQAGTEAIQHIQEFGLQAEDIDIIPGAAGGPKGIGICGLDQAIFGDFLAQAPKKRTYIGSSIGCWRFASIAAHGGHKGPEMLARLYNDIDFHSRMKPEDVSQQCFSVLEEMLRGKTSSVIDHPDMQLVMIMARCYPMLRSNSQILLAMGLMGLYGCNLLSRRSMNLFMQRCYAYSDAHNNRMTAVHDHSGFSGQHISLSEHNLLQILMATVAIPLVMDGVTDIPLAPKGLYRDGGLIDYHLDLPFNSKGLVLYPHYHDQIIPGWFDKSIRWRKANSFNHKRTILISPSSSYLNSLPLGQLPDRKDFDDFAGNNVRRKKIWEQSIAESQRLGDEFLELVHGGKIAEYLEPL
ncbi:patatin-like phospholipase family protein [Acinetobacter junii]|uniref:patatin-like phospholipase family protein n=1 Tax=Acinetobacter junii TaxID=40215 RepID=UPI0032144A31